MLAEWICGYAVDMKHCGKLQNVMMYPVQLVDVFSDTFQPLIQSAINVSTEMDEIVAGQAIKGYVLHFTASVHYFFQDLTGRVSNSGREHYWCQIFTTFY